jgi:hypothetical protein
MWDPRRLKPLEASTLAEMTLRKLLHFKIVVVSFFFLALKFITGPWAVKFERN